MRLVQVQGAISQLEALDSAVTAARKKKKQLLADPALRHAPPPEVEPFKLSSGSSRAPRGLAPSASEPTFKFKARTFNKQIAESRMGIKPVTPRKVTTPRSPRLSRRESMPRSPRGDAPVDTRIRKSAELDL